MPDDPPNPDGEPIPVKAPRSALQAEASRNNGGHSHGPVTEEGKAISARNATKHGLLSRKICFNDEDEQRIYVLSRDALFADLNPVGDMEVGYVEEILDCRLMLGRCAAYSTERTCTEYRPSEKDQIKIDYTARVRRARAFFDNVSAGRDAALDEVDAITVFEWMFVQPNFKKYEEHLQGRPRAICGAYDASEMPACTRRHVIEVLTGKQRPSHVYSLWNDLIVQLLAFLEGSPGYRPGLDHPRVEVISSFKVFEENLVMLDRAEQYAGKLRRRMDNALVRLMTLQQIRSDKGM